MTVTTTRDVSIPAGVSWVRDWEDWQSIVGSPLDSAIRACCNGVGHHYSDCEHRDGLRRYFATPSTVIECSQVNTVEVFAAGWQLANGAVNGLEVVVTELHHDHPITAAQARQIASALIAAADAAENLSAR